MRRPNGACSSLDPTLRDEAAATLTQACAARGLTVATVDVPDDDWAAAHRRASAPCGSDGSSSRPRGTYPCHRAMRLVVVIQPSMGFGTGTSRDDAAVSGADAGRPTAASGRCSTSAPAPASWRWPRLPLGARVGRGHRRRSGRGGERRGEPGVESIACGSRGHPLPRERSTVRLPASGAGELATLGMKRSAAQTSCWPTSRARSSSRRRLTCWRAPAAAAR